MLIIETRDLDILDISLPRTSLQEYVETRKNIITYIQPLFVAMTMQLWIIFVHGLIITFKMYVSIQNKFDIHVHTCIHKKQ